MNTINIKRFRPRSDQAQPGFKAGFVYAVRCDGNKIKIGEGESVEARLREPKRWGLRPEVLQCWPAIDPRSAEQSIHAVFGRAFKQESEEVFWLPPSVQVQLQNLDDLEFMEWIEMGAELAALNVTPVRAKLDAARRAWACLVFPDESSFAYCLLAAPKKPDYETVLQLFRENPTGFKHIRLGCNSKDIRDAYHVLSWRCRVYESLLGLEECEQEWSI